MNQDPRTLIALQLGLETIARIEAQATAEALHRELQELKAQITPATQEAENG